MNVVAGFAAAIIVIYSARLMRSSLPSVGPTGTGDSGAASLRLSVRDDGSGIAPGTVPGMGWSGMEERVRALGGRLCLMSEPDGGTRLDVVIPLEAPESRETAGQELT